MKPYPFEKFGEVGDIAKVDACRMAAMSVGDRLGSASNNSAATAATCGVAAEVPWKLGKVVPLAQPDAPFDAVLAPMLPPRKVSLPPSGPTTSGFCLTC